MKNQNKKHNESIIGCENLTVGDFWSWAYSDILSNRNRSIFAEFIVGSALGVIDTPRIEWDGVDLHYNNKKIEVKSAAYLQSWQQNGPSVIRYDISKKMSWHADDNSFETEPIRAADCYVFCLYTEMDETKANIIDLRAWQFFILNTEQIEQELGNQKSIGINGIQAICNPVRYNKLKSQIDIVLKIDQK